jgi:hypothetical protein
MWFDYDKPPAKSSLSEYNFIHDNTLYIPANTWIEITEAFTQKEITDHLIGLIQRLPFPHRKYTEETLVSNFKSLCDEESSYELGEWSSPRLNSQIDLLYMGKPLFLKGTNNGMWVSNNYTQEFRMECDYNGKKDNSPMYEWRNASKDKSNFLRCLFGIIAEEIVPRGGVQTDVLHRALKMHTYMASQFKPSVAKNIYDFFGAKNVLDFSAGWGDRLVGFLASGAESYIGIDPNTKLHAPYQNIADWVSQRFPLNKSSKFICSPAEEVDYSTLEYDFVFTSPPYFDIERYSYEPTQSWIKHPTLDLWLDGFLLKTLGGLYAGLKEGGRIAVNISDKKGGGEICQPMLEHMKSLGATYEGVIGYKMHKRPGTTQTQQVDVFCEPVFIWSKGRAVAPLWNGVSFF